MGRQFPPDRGFEPPTSAIGSGKLSRRATAGESLLCLLAGKISWRTYFRLSANRHFTFRGHGGIPRAASVAEALVWTPQLAAAPNDYLLTRMMRLVLALLGFLLPTALPVPAAPISGGIGLSVKSFVRCGTPCPLNFSP